MDSRLTIKQRKRNFLTWLLIFVMVFNSLPMDVRADMDFGMLSDGHDFTPYVGVILYPGETISWNTMSAMEAGEFHPNKVDLIITYCVGTTYTDDKDGQRVLVSGDAANPASGDIYHYSHTISSNDSLSYYDSLTDAEKDIAGWKIASQSDIQDTCYSGDTYITTICLTACYTVKWVDGDGNTLSENILTYGDLIPDYDSTSYGIPTKSEDEYNTYVFNNTWSPAFTSGDTVAGAVTYVAQFDATPKTYSVSFNTNGHGTGSAPAAQTGLTYGSYVTEPTPKLTDPDYEFTYWYKEAECTTSWNFASDMVSGDMTLYAGWKEKKYTVSWNNYDGVTLKTDEYVKGVTPVYTGPTPERAADAQYTYTFNDTWTPDIVPVNGPATYTASFNQTLNQYPVHWIDGDGNELKTDSVSYGNIPVYTGATPTKTATAQYTYTFNNTWTPAIVAVTGEATYTASFNASVNKYTVSWNNYNGTNLKTQTGVDYGASPVYDGAIPTKPKDAANTYTFSGWDPVQGPISGNTVYVAQYTVSGNKYTVSFNANGHGSAPASQTVSYNELASDPGKITGVTGYTFVDWYKEAGCINKWNFASDRVMGPTTIYAKWEPNVYTVSFNMHGHGTQVASQNKAYGTKVDKPSDPSEYGYDFAGWYEDAGYTVAWDFTSKTVAGPTTIHAKWTPAMFTVSFNMNGHGVQVASQNRPYMQNVIKPGNPSETGYSFGGWYKQAACSVSWNFTEDKVMGPTTLYAKWTANSYDIVYNLDGGTNASGNPASYTYGEGVVSLADPSKTGHTFDKWYTDAAKTTPAGSPVISANSIGVKTFWAKWNPNIYNITYELDGGTNAAGNPSTYTYGIGVNSLADPSKTGYTFNGWYTDAGKTVQVGTPVISGTDMEDKTFYAKWTAKNYTVTWKNYDNTTLSTNILAYGATPVYGGEVPTKPSTVSQDFTHEGWTPAIKPVSENTVYTATFTASPRIYTITWKNYDGTVLQTDNLAYGAIPAYTGIPTKPSDAQYSYTFNGWDKAIVAVVGDETYTAQYTPVLRTYTVTWINEDGSVLETDTGVAYGTMPSYDGATPTKGEDEGNTYSFTGWSPAVTAVTGDANYYATYTNTPKQFTVTFVDEDGTTVLKEATPYNYGTRAADIVKPDDPVKAETAQYRYTFAGWTPELADVTADAVYTAAYIETLRSYTITWKNDDGSVLKENTAAYGTMPEYTGDTPSKKATEKYTYTFAGWSPDIEVVTGDAVYTATYTETVNTCTVTWVNYNGSVLETDEVEYGSTPEYNGDTPKRAADDNYTYKFKGWSPEVGEVTKDTTYTATYSKKKIEKPAEEEPQPKDIPEETPPAAPAPVPVKAAGELVRSPQTDEDRRGRMIAASALSLSMIMLGVLIIGRKKNYSTDK